MQKYREVLIDSFSAWIRNFKISSLVEHERILSELLDSDLFVESLLIDEAIVMYDLIRDECVRRLGEISDCE